MTGSHDTHPSVVHILKMTAQESPTCAAAATSEAELHRENICFTSGMMNTATEPGQASRGWVQTLVCWTDCRWCQGLCTESLQTLDKLPSLILLVFDLETDMESLHIMRGHRLWANVFSIEPRSIRASWFTSVLKWLFGECHKWGGQGSSFQKLSLGQTGHPKTHLQYILCCTVIQSKPDWQPGLKVFILCNCLQLETSCFPS